MVKQLFEQVWTILGSFGLEMGVFIQYIETSDLDSLDIKSEMILHWAEKNVILNWGIKENQFLIVPKRVPEFRFSPSHPKWNV